MTKGLIKVFFCGSAIWKIIGLLRECKCRSAIKNKKKKMDFRQARRMMYMREWEEFVRLKAWE